jgi:predicted nucleic acid-binding Zn ribbon protein
MAGRITDLAALGQHAAHIAFDDVVRLERKFGLSPGIDGTPGTEVFCSVCCDESLSTLRRQRRRLQLLVYCIKLRLLLLELKLEVVNLVRKTLRFAIGRV